MQIKQSDSNYRRPFENILLLLFFSPVAAISQTTYLPQGAEENHPD
jgi:hypothetical protein